MEGVWGRLAGAGRWVLRGLTERCPACGGLLPAGEGPVCPECAVALAPRLGGYCPLCGEPGDDPEAEVGLCPTCRAGARPFDGVVFHGRYEGLLRDIILDFKFRGRLGQAGLLGGLLAGAWRRMAPEAPRGPDCVVPVPLHPRRLAWRGFNQSLELARVLGRALDCPVRADGVARIRYTTPQSQLPGPRRLENIRGAFRADPAVVDGRRVVVVDDVMTTGATMETVCRALLQAGADGVTVAVVAR